MHSERVEISRHLILHTSVHGKAPEIENFTIDLAIFVIISQTITGKVCTRYGFDA